MKSGFLVDGSHLPLGVQPDGPHDPVRDPVSLTGWAIEQVDWIEDKLLNHGALLFRGYGFDSPEVFESFAGAISPKFMDYTRGTSPRKKVKGHIYTSTEAPSIASIPLHCEMSYLNQFPGKILFYCHIPAKRGGQTPIADMRRVCEAIDSGVRRRFEEKELRLIQNVPERRTVFAPRSWREMFETDDRAFVESFCRSQGIAFQWKPDGTLQLINIRPAVLKHPKTAENVWFNSAHNFHDSLSWEVRRLGRRLIAGLLKLAEWKRRRQLRAEDRPYHCTFADGSEIPIEDIDHIRAVLWNHAVLFDWQRGDVLVLNNTLIAHGRMPYSGPRRVLVALSEPWDLSAPTGASAIRLDGGHNDPATK